MPVLGFWGCCFEFGFGVFGGWLAGVLWFVLFWVCWCYVGCFSDFMVLLLVWVWWFGFLFVVADSAGFPGWVVYGEFGLVYRLDLLSWVSVSGVGLV